MPKSVRIEDVRDPRLRELLKRERAFFDAIDEVYQQSRHMRGVKLANISGNGSLPYCGR